MKKALLNLITFLFIASGIAGMSAVGILLLSVGGVLVAQRTRKSREVPEEV